MCPLFLFLLLVGASPAVANEDEIFIPSLNETFRLMKPSPDEKVQSVLLRSPGDPAPENRTVFPKKFDLSEMYPECNLRRSFHQYCGTCGAVAAATMMTDVICITTGKKSPEVSAGELCDCSGERWQGVHPNSAIKYWIKNGITFGGYGTDGCYPYQGPSNNHNTCPYKNVTVCDQKRRACSCNGRLYPKQQITAVGEYRLQEALLKHKVPFSACLKMVDSFSNYRPGEILKSQIPIDDYCNHAMKLIGWDTDPKTGEQFWILVNSWGPKWAMNGTMHIRLGHNDANLDVHWHHTALLK